MSNDTRPDNGSTTVELRDGVQIISIFDENGNMVSQKFEPVEPARKDGKPKKDTLDEVESRPTGFFASLKYWYDRMFIKPYVKIRDLADPFRDREDADAGSDGRNAAEIGIRVDF